MNEPCQATIDGAQCVIHVWHPRATRFVRVEVAGAVGNLYVTTSTHRTVTGREFEIAYPYQS